MEPDAAERRVAYAVRRDKALATIVLSVETRLLYLLGDPVDPRIVWERLVGQFQRKSWANKLELKRKLFSMKLDKEGVVQAHIKAMTELLDELSIIDVPVKEEDRVVYLLASLPDQYDMLVTALEASRSNRATTSRGKEAKESHSGKSQCWRRGGTGNQIQQAIPQQQGTEVLRLWKDGAHSEKLQ